MSNFKKGSLPRPIFCLNYLIETAPFLLLFFYFALGIASIFYGKLHSIYILPAFFYLFVKHRRFHWLAALFFLGGILRGLLGLYTESHNIRSQLPRTPCYIESRLKIKEGYAIDPKIAQYQPINLPITAVLQTICTHQHPNSHLPTSCKVLLVCAKKNRTKMRRLHSGDILSTTGIFQNIPQLESPNIRYEKYLQSTKIQGIYKITNFTKKGPDNTFFTTLESYLQSTREALARQVLDGFLPRSHESHMILALSLGYHNALEYNIKKFFLHSGTIHIFAISGLHVGLFFASMLFFFLQCGFPIKFRWGLSGLLTIGYVFITGISPSSIRALSMVLLMIYATFRNKPALPLNTLGQIGFLSLFINPRLLQNAGFLFSYITVFFLLAGLSHLQYIQTILQELNYWIPRHNRSNTRIEHMRTAMIYSVLSCVLAWAASMGVTMQISGQLCFLSPLLNLVLIPLIPLCLIAVPIKILCTVCGWTFGKNICIAAIHFILRRMLQLTEWGSQFPGTTILGIQPILSIFFFYAGLLILLCSNWQQIDKLISPEKRSFF
ncbi:MAG: ComEC/Rec2 family competence protein [Lentisphaeria bacterium]